VEGVEEGDREEKRGGRCFSGGDGVGRVEK
jgi:hypothetical protein